MRVCLARIVGAHGIKGLVKVRSFTHNPTDLFHYRPLTDAKGQPYNLRLDRFLPNGVMLCHLDGCTSRSDAERYHGPDLLS